VGSLIPPLRSDLEEGGCGRTTGLHLFFLVLSGLGDPPVSPTFQTPPKPLEFSPSPSRSVVSLLVKIGPTLKATLPTPFPGFFPVALWRVIPFFIS